MDLDIDGIDYTDPSLAPDPYRHLDYLAAHRPVYREPHHGVVMVTGHEEAITVLRSPDVFSSATLIAGPDPWSLLPERPEGDDITEFVNAHREYLPQNDQIVTADPPVHTAQRALLMGLITPKRLKENEEFIWRLTDRQLDYILPARHGRAHGRLRAALHPADHRRPARGAGGRPRDAAGPPRPEPDARHQARRRLRAQACRRHQRAQHAGGLLRLLLREDRRAPGAAAQRRADRHGPGAVPRRHRPRADRGRPDRVQPVRRRAGDHRSADRTALRRIAEEPETQAQLRANRDLVPRFVEETLRTEGPILGEYRLAIKTTELGGVPIPAGTQVFLSNGAANRDPRQFECPAEFRATRENVRRHIAFGHGVHTCPGAPLARSETRITIERLLDRTTDIRINEAAHGPAGSRRYDYLKTHMFHGIATLHLDFTARD